VVVLFKVAASRLRMRFVRNFGSYFLGGAELETIQGDDGVEGRGAAGSLELWWGSCLIRTRRGDSFPLFLCFDSTLNRSPQNNTNTAHSRDVATAVLNGDSSQNHQRTLPLKAMSQSLFSTLRAHPLYKYMPVCNGCLWHAPYVKGGEEGGQKMNASLSSI
jgi:hypothetical protein